MGENCHVTDILRENISQEMLPMGTGLLPGDKYPNWLTFNGNGSSVYFKVPQVDGLSLKTIMCILYFSSPEDIASEGLKVLLVVNCTKNTILVCKRDALLTASDEEWQRLVSNTEPGDKVKVIVGFENGFKVMKTTVYLIYDEPIDGKTKHCDEPDKNVIVSSGGKYVFGRLFFRLPSRAQGFLISRPFWFCLAGIMVWWSRRRSDKQKSLRSMK